ncbi:MAG TPA: hypothetical protein VMK13_06490 [Streptosporangiaceae bacterium]|nr:hypothetical protein [Streptosporangiaceae bacterium]
MSRARAHAPSLTARRRSQTARQDGLTTYSVRAVLVVAGPPNLADQALTKAGRHRQEAQQAEDQG